MKLFEKKFYFDELYDAVFYKPADLISRGLGRFFERPVIAGSLGEITQGFRFGSGEVAPRPERARPRLRPRPRERRRRPRRRLHRLPMSDWLTTILIVLPIAGALVVWLLPLPKQMAGSLATLISLVEVGIWIVALERFDFSSGGLQFAQQHTWFSEINSSYHVGLFALLALARRADRRSAARGAASYAWWVGPRAVARLLRADALPDRLGRRRLRRRRTCCSSTRSSRRC